MKHLWAAVALLAALLGSLAFNGWKLQEVIHPLSRQVEQASQAAWGGNWGEAETLLSQAEAGWSAHRVYLQMVQCHAEVEELGILFAEARAQLQGREMGAYQAANARILQRMGNFAEKESLSADNLL